MAPHPTLYLFTGIRFLVRETKSVCFANDTHNITAPMTALPRVQETKQQIQCVPTPTRTYEWGFIHKHTETLALAKHKLTAPNVHIFSLSFPAGHHYSRDYCEALRKACSAVVRIVQCESACLLTLAKSDMESGRGCLQAKLAAAASFLCKAVCHVVMRHL